VEKAKKFWCNRRQRNKSLLQDLGLWVLPNFRYSSKCFAEIYRAQYGNAMLVYIRGTPIWRPENSVNIWNLLWLSRRLIVSAEQTSIYVSSFPNNLISKKARNYEISTCFWTINNYSPKARWIVLNNPRDEVEGIIHNIHRAWGE